MSLFFCVFVVIISYRLVVLCALLLRFMALLLIFVSSFFALAGLGGEVSELTHTVLFFSCQMPSGASGRHTSSNHRT